MKPSCNKCDISKCKAQCCTYVTMPLSFLKKYESKMTRQCYGYINPFPNDKVVIPITHVEIIPKEVNGKSELCNYIDSGKQICPFLNDEYRCVVYEHRPEICKVYGTTLQKDHPFTCHFHLGKDYSFPKDNPPGINEILKYKNSMIKNNKLLEEMGIDDIFH